MEQTIEHDSQQVPATVPGTLPVICQPHAFANAYRTGVTAQGRTIAEILADCDLPPVVLQYTRVWVDDCEVPADLWRHLRPKTGHTVYVRVIAQGGNGGKALRTVLAVVIAVAAVVTGQYYAAEMGFTEVAASGATVLTTQGMFVAAGITVGVNMLGNLALNALIPPQLPTSPDGGSLTNPRYQLTGTQNRLEPYAPIPRVFGTRRMYPLMAARPYSEVQGNDQYLRIALMVGWGPVKISDIRIGETPIDDFQDVEYEVREGWYGVSGHSNDAALTLFTRTVTEQNFNALLDYATQTLVDPGYSDGEGGGTPPTYSNTPGEWATRTSDTNATELIVDVTFPGGLVMFDDQSNRLNNTVTFDAQYKLSSDSSWTSITWANSDQAGFGTAGQISVTAADTSTIRASGRFYTPSEGQYDVRIRRTSIDNGNRFIDQCYWTTLRTVQPEDPVPQPGLALIALRIKASGQLNGVPNSINCIAQSYLPVWDGSAWSYEASNNPAWAYTHALRYRGPESMMADSRIDLVAMKAWADACDATAPNASEPRWEFNGVIEGGSTFTALRQIAAHARATFAIKDGKYSITRDIQQSVPVQHITPRNSNGYSGKKDFLDYPHALRVQFVNADKGYQEDEFIVYDDGYSASNATRFETLELPGCTSAYQAWREGRYLIAAGRLRPEEHTVMMDVESVRCQQGDLVRFSHDAISVGIASTRAAAVATSGGAITSITLEDAVGMEAGKTYGIRARRADGTSKVLAVVNPGAGYYTTLTPSTTTLTSNGPAVGDLVMFGETSLESAPMMVKKIENGPNFTAKLTLVDAQSGVYTADTGSIPTFVSNITVQGPIEQAKPDAPVVSNVRSNETIILRLADGTLQSRILIVLAPPLASVVPVETYETYWRLTGETSWQVAKTEKDSPIYLSPVIDGGQYEFKVRSVSRYGVPSGFCAVQSHTVVGKTSPPSTPASMSASLELDTILLSWASVYDTDLLEYEVRFGTVWETATVVGRARATTMKVTPKTIGLLTWMVKAIDTSGNYSSSAVSASVVLGGPLVVNPSASFSGDQVLLRWSPPAFITLPIDYYEIRYGSTFAGGTSLGRVSGTTFQTKAAWSGTRKFWVVAVDVQGNVGTAGSTEAVVNVAAAPSITAQVVDNNVLLFWNAVQGSLPTDTYEIRRGSTWAGADVIGTKSGIFTTIFETAGGSYTYWIAAIDAAGNYGTPGSTAASVNQPPDYVLKLDHDSDFSGTKSNMAASGDGGWLLPVNTTETYAEHFTSRSWATPKAQVDAGYPLVIEPTLNSGYYEEVVDAGALLSATKITLAVNGATFNGTSTVTTKISTSPDFVTWTDYDGVTEIFTSGFQYVKYRITVTTSDNTSLYRIAGIALRIDSKLKNDADTANAYLTQTGTYAQSGNTITVTISGHGRSAGEHVYLDFTSGTAVDGLYRIVSATTNTLTVGTQGYTSGFSTSGSVTADANGTPIYFNVPFADVSAVDVTPRGTTPLIPVVNFVDVPNPLFFRILLFTTSGTRSSGTVSWSAKGY